MARKIATSISSDFPVWQTVYTYTYFRNWRKDGTWVEIHHTLHDCWRGEEDCDSSPSEAMLDLQVIKNVTAVS